VKDEHGDEDAGTTSGDGATARILNARNNFQNS